MARLDWGGGGGGALSGAATGASIGSIIPGIGTGIGAGIGGAIGGLTGLFGGRREKKRQFSTLNKQQQGLQDQYINALQNKGAGGAFGDVADYYRGLLSGEGQDFDAMMQPEMRRFNEQIVPDLAEQFAGLGSGGLSSSGFRNSAVNAGADLSERLAAMRAQLRQQGAQGLSSLAQGGLRSTVENVYHPREPGFAESFAPAAGQIAAAGLFNNRNSSPYGNQQSNQQSMQAPTQSYTQQIPKMQMPTFMNR